MKQTKHKNKQQKVAILCEKGYIYIVDMPEDLQEFADMVAEEFGSGCNWQVLAEENAIILGERAMHRHRQQHEQEIDFMDDSEHNPILENYISERLTEENEDDDTDVQVVRHERGDGKHVVYLDGQRAFNVNAWDSPEWVVECIEELMQ